MSDFIVTGDFVESAARLEKNDRAAIWKTLRQLAQNVSSKGLNVEKLEVGKGLLSCRISASLRMIFSRWKKAIILYYVDQHDEAYRFAERVGEDTSCGASTLSRLLGESPVAAYVQDFVMTPEIESLTRIQMLVRQALNGDHFSVDDVALLVEGASEKEVTGV